MAQDDEIPDGVGFMAVNGDATHAGLSDAVSVTGVATTEGDICVTVMLGADAVTVSVPQPVAAEGASLRPLVASEKLPPAPESPGVSTVCRQ